MFAVFMIGTQRSGSNLLRLMLGQSPHLWAPHPPHLITSFHTWGEKYGKLEGQSWAQLCRDMLAWVAANPVPWPGPLPELEKLLALPQRSIVHASLFLYQYAAKQNGAKGWVCKSMGNVAHLADIHAILPKARYLHLVRDGRDVGCSFQKTLVGPKHPYFAAQRWTKDQELALAWEQKVSPEQFLRVRYEELVCSPAENLQRICAFLKIPFTGQMLRFYESEASKQTADSGRMWSRLVEPVQADGVGRFRRQWTDTDIRIFESLAGATMQKLSYPLNFSGKSQAYTLDELAEFRRLDENWRREAQVEANVADLAKRAPQQALQAKIMARPTVE
jgi:hypothetical protein